MSDLDEDGLPFPEIDNERFITCSSCGKVDADDVEERSSFGVYAGRLCTKCCGTYRDNCGLDGDQGDPADLDEPYWEEEE